MAVFGNNSQTGQTGTNNLRAVTETVNKNSIQVKLNNGTDPSTGQVRTVSGSFPTLSLEPNDYDAQKVMNIVEAMVPVLTKSVYAVQHTQISLLSD